MLESAKKVLADKIDSMQEEGLLALLEDTFPYVSAYFECHILNTRLSFLSE